MSVFFASDWHLGHKLAAIERGFSCVEEHDDYIIHTAAFAITKRDKLFILGDVAFGPRALQRVKDVPGVKALVLGNHDRLNAKRYLEPGLFNDLHGSFRYDAFLLTHVPSSVADGYRWRGNLHGHIHDNPRYGKAEASPKHLNLVAERWQFQPLPFEEIQAIFRAREAVQEAENEHTENLR